MNHSLVIFLTILQLTLCTNLVSAEVLAELKNGWTKVEIGFPLEGDHGENNRISGSCVRFLKIENSDKILLEVCKYKKSNTAPEWSCVETKRVSLIDYTEMKSIVKRFDDLHTSEKKEWRALDDSEKSKRFREVADNPGPASSGRMAYRVERNNQISVYGFHVGGKLPHYSLKAASILDELAARSNRVPVTD